MKIKTSELTGWQLDLAVMQLEADCAWYVTDTGVLMEEHGEVATPYQPSSRWAQGGPIIEREGIGYFCNRTAEVGARFTPDAGADWRAFAYNKHMEHHFGPTPLIAAMRCYVASKLGDVIEIPEGLS